MRLDKYLANANLGSRKEVNKLIKKGEIYVNGTIIKNPKTDVGYEDDIVYIDVPIILEEFMYFMMNKPDGVISSTEEGPTETVIDLIAHPQQGELFPVGRLDKDTLGLLFITNDGKLAHKLLSPKNEYYKTYHVTLLDEVTEADITQLETGIELKEFTTKPAKAELLNPHEVSLSITEGKFHQVKRMFLATGNEVVKLKRTNFAALELDGALAEGEYRRLTEEEIKKLNN
ncbi:pseudouridine synthase [Jeotgalicoccus psychrophilus]|uniref:pseudouridine synthase n=1 Tax=Jeotgalicoccus psychrophilus TaxID=157228 RepID=UPI0003FF6F02|nr:pseudouridine synthase [Jeotgalicoccus psychrophilus]